MPQDLYVVGGQQRSLRSIRTGARDWYEYQKGLVLRVDVERAAVTSCLEYVSPPEACASHEPVILFKSGTLVDGQLYLSTQTEVLVYDVPSFVQRQYISLPMFNDVHHVRPTPWGTLLVANTGLDMVMELSQHGDVLREWNVLGDDPWQCFQRDLDYRKGISTKPHKAHPNYIFLLGDDIWTTRFVQRDAVSLTSPGERIAIDLEKVHDGVLEQDELFFTTVNGNVVIVEAATRQVREIIDLNAIDDRANTLGWCRSIHVDGDRLWVGFSRLRPTRIRDNVSWVKNGFRRMLPTRLACYSRSQRCLLHEIDLEPYGLNAVFGIFGVPSSVAPQ